MSELARGAAVARRSRSTSGPIRTTSSVLALRMRVIRQRERLDARLCAGADPRESAELELRARELCARRTRETIAAALEEAVELARRGGLQLSSRPPLARGAIRTAGGALLELAGELRADSTVQPAGVALAQRLLIDGAGPLYVRGDGEELWHQAREAACALRRGASR